MKISFEVFSSSVHYKLLFSLERASNALKKRERSKEAIRDYKAPKTFLKDISPYNPPFLTIALHKGPNQDDTHKRPYLWQLQQL